MGLTDGALPLGWEHRILSHIHQQNALEIETFDEKYH